MLAQEFRIVLPQKLKIKNRTSSFYCVYAVVGNLPKVFHNLILTYPFFLTRGEKEANYDEIIEGLEKRHSTAAEEFQAKGQEASAEQVRNLENERDSLKNECDQERIAYQKLLKAYNKLEAQFENAQDELNAIKNPNGSEANFDSMSFASMSMNEDESAYGGSVSGTSSMRSSNVPEIAVKDGLGVPVGSSGRSGAEEDRIDVGLTVRLQHKLKETQFAKDKLEKRLEQLENRGKYHLDIILSTYDVFSLSMYFVKMGRKAISKFYNFFPLSNKTKLHQNHLLLCQLVSYIHCSISKFPSIHK